MINLANEIFRRLKHVGFKLNLSNDKLEVVRFYLNTAVEKMFGRTEFEPSEFDLITTKQGFELKMFNQDVDYEIKAEGSNIICTSSDGSIPVVIMVDGSSLRSEVEVCKDGLVTRDIYDIDIAKSLYSLRKEQSDSEEFDVVYEGSLSSIGAKNKDVEYFCYTKVSPLVEVEKKSFLKKIYDGIVNDDIVGIRTTLEISELPFFCTEIFNLLEEKCKKTVLGNGNGRK